MHRTENPTMFVRFGPLAPNTWFSSLVERCAVDTEKMVRFHHPGPYGPLAQLVERRTLTPKVSWFEPRRGFHF